MTAIAQESKMNTTYKSHPSAVVAKSNGINNSENVAISSPTVNTPNQLKLTWPEDNPIKYCDLYASQAEQMEKRYSDPTWDLMFYLVDQLHEANTRSKREATYWILNKVFALQVQSETRRYVANTVLLPIRSFFRIW